MSIIKIKCVDQSLTIANRPLIASGGQQENMMIFEFCAMWDGFEKTAVFYRNENEVYNVLIVNNECEIPNEVLEEEGKFYFGVFGVNGVQRRTSVILNYQVSKGSYILGQEPSEPTPDVYSQMMNLHNQILTQYNNIFANVNSLVAEAVLQGVVNQNDENELVKFWFGTQNEYNALTEQLSNTVYIIEDEDLIVNKATIALYASEDKTKGTIEERLTKLGFKEGTFAMTGGSAATENIIRKQGKYVIASLSVVQGNTGVISVSQEFRPKQKTKVLAQSFNEYMVLGSGILYLNVDGILYNDEACTTKYEWTSLFITNAGWETN